MLYAKNKINYFKLVKLQKAGQAAIKDGLKKYLTARHFEGFDYFKILD